MEPSTSADARAETEFLDDYRNISAKLKRRFLRRPNVTEASDQFTRLAKRLRDADEPQYAALCHLAAARCEQSAANVVDEAESLVAASRNFLRAELKVDEVGCPSLDEHLTAGIHSYNHAVRLLEEDRQPSRAAGLCLELAHALRSLGRTGQALTFYQRAADLNASTILEYMRAREEVAACHVDLGDLLSALAVATEVADMAEQYGGKPVESAYADILSRCEILRVLLLLLLKPTSQNIPPNLLAFLDKYSWESDDPTGAGEDMMRILSEEVFLLLQSIVMAAQVSDGMALRQLEDCLASYLDPRPRTLLRKIVAEMKDSE